MIISLHLGSLLLGILVGYAISSIVLLIIMYDDRWSTGFGVGWNACLDEHKHDTEKEENDV